MRKESIVALLLLSLVAIPALGQDKVLNIGYQPTTLHMAEIVAAEVIRPRPPIVAAGADEVGGLQIKVKQQRRLRIRIPEFLAAGEVQVAINGKKAIAHQDGAFLDLGTVRRGDQVEVFYAMKTRTTKEHVAPGEFEFRWRGATVVDASPRQKIRPLFDKSRFEQSPPQLGPAVGSEAESL